MQNTMEDHKCHRNSYKEIQNTSLFDILMGNKKRNNKNDLQMKY